MHGENGFSEIFYIMLTIGVIGFIGFFVVAAGALGGM